MLTGGERVTEDGYFYAPTVIDGLQQGDEMARTEIFGPVITVQSFSDEDEALRWANGTDYGLASSVWTSNHKRALRMSRALDFGCVWINCHIPLVAEMPHGGFKQSGYGKDLSGVLVRGVHAGQARDVLDRGLRPARPGSTVRWIQASQAIAIDQPAGHRRRLERQRRRRRRRRSSPRRPPATCPGAYGRPSSM